MDDEDDIHDRLEQLEARVADQQQTIEQLTEQPAVGRRSVVASLLGAGAVGGLAGYGSQSARAQASGPAGQVGTGEEPVDGFLWDLDVQGQVTSDLPMGGNDVTGVGALDVEQLNTAPTGARVRLDGNQTIAEETFTKIAWEIEGSRGEVSDILDAADNSVVVPQGFNWAKISVSIRWESATNIRDVRSRLNGGSVTGEVNMALDGGGQFNAVVFSPSASSWIPVSDGDEITAEVRHVEDTSQDLRDDSQTWMEVILL